MLRKQYSSFALGMMFFLVIASEVQGHWYWPGLVPPVDRRWNSYNTNPRTGYGGDLLFLDVFPSGEMRQENKPRYSVFNAEPKIAPMETVPVCAGSTFCEDVPNYPTEIVNRAIMNDESLKNYKAVDVVEEISGRIGEPSAETVCKSTERVVYPKSGETKDREWMFILNTDNFTQGVWVEECDKEDDACSIIEELGAGRDARCKQKYIYRQLKGLDRSQTVNTYHFRFAASCCCHVEFTGHMGMRFGFPDNSKFRYARKTPAT